MHCVRILSSVAMPSRDVLGILCTLSWGGGGGGGAGGQTQTLFLPVLHNCIEWLCNVHKRCTIVEVVEG